MLAINCANERDVDVLSVNRATIVNFACFTSCNEQGRIYIQREVWKMGETIFPPRLNMGQCYDKEGYFLESVFG